MKVLSALLTLTFASLLPVDAQSASGMRAMQYYVGKWSCLTGPIGQAPVKTIETYGIDSGIMRESYFTPVQGSMKKSESLNMLTAYDARHDRYVAVDLDNAGGWITAEVTLNGNAERWTYRTERGDSGRATVVRTDRNHFTFTSYPTLTAAKPDFREVCQRAATPG